jgi:alpha-beta hydrolase superfamily lysophospholipase
MPPLTPPHDRLSHDLAAGYGVVTTFDGLVGLLHPAAGTMGAVIVPHWGFDGLCFHPMTRRLAADLAAAGVACLRYDPPGAGHSRDRRADEGEANLSEADLSEADLFEAWAASVGAAVEQLRRLTGVRQVALIGFGLGAAAAARASARIEGLAGVALLAPWLSGRRALRELSAAARLTAEAMGATLDEGPGDGGLSVAGFTLTGRDRDSLARIETTAATLRASPATLIVARTEQSASARALAEALGPDRARLSAFEGYEKAAFDPSNFVMPQAVVAEVVAFARGLADDAGPLASQAPAPEAFANQPGPITREPAGYVEEALRFGPGGRLFGVLSAPAGTAPRAAVALINAGRNRSIGWARGDVEEARRLARAGVAALRFDIAGVGDSAPESDEEPLYDARRAVDVAAAIDLFETRFGPVAAALRGPCSGAYLAFQSALGDPRVKGLALINAQRYVWNPRESFDAVMRQPVHTVELAREARDPRQIRRLLTGEISPRVLAARLSRRAWREVQAQLGRRGLALTHEAGLVAQGRRGFETLAARDARLKIIVSEGDRAIEELRLFFGDDAAFAHRHGQEALVRIAPADHNLTAPDARRAASAALDALIAEMAARA